MNIYNITKGQLITAWVFGLSGGLVMAETATNSVLPVVMLFVLIFYTIGWRNYRKNKVQ